MVTDRLSKETLVALSNYKPIQEFIKESDYILYQRLVEVLVPDVLRAVPSEFRVLISRAPDYMRVYQQQTWQLKFYPLTS